MSSNTRAPAVREAPGRFCLYRRGITTRTRRCRNRFVYYQSIIDTIIDIGQARAFIIALAELIQRLAIAFAHHRRHL